MNQLADIEKIGSSWQKKALAFSCLFLFVSGCKLGSDESQVQELQQNLSLASNAELSEKLIPGQCLIEVTKNFTEKNQTLSVDLTRDGSWLPIAEADPDFAWRGRLDLEENSVEGPTPLVLALIVDTSGSLSTTDPRNHRTKGVKRLLIDMGKRYKGFYGSLKVKVISFSYCSKNPEVFSGSTESEYHEFVKRVVRRGFPHGGETNYIQPMKDARDFINANEFPGKSTNKHLVMFSDGMPWMKNAEVPNTCSNVIGELKSKLEAGTIVQGLGINDFDGTCLEGPTASSCKIGTRPDKIGLSQLKVNSSLDPTNFRLAMKQTIDFAAKNITNPGISLHTIYLKTGKCWEYRNSRSSLMKAEFEHLCNNVTVNHFFPALQGNKDGATYTVKNIEDLETRFGDLANYINDQLQFNKISYFFPQRKRSSESQEIGPITEKPDEGGICNQINGAINCPLLAKGEHFDPPVKGEDNENGNYNFHLGFNNMVHEGQIRMNAGPTRLKKKVDPNEPKHFYINYNLPNRKTEIKGSGFSVIEEKGVSENRMNILIQKDVPNEFRITCSTTVGVTLDCEMKGGTRLPHGGKTSGGLICYHQKDCSRTIDENYTCNNGKITPAKLACPAGYGPQICVEPVPTLCPRNEAVDKVGKVGETWKIPGYQFGKHENCEQYQGSRNYVCRESGYWELINPVQAGKYEYPNCTPIQSPKPEYKPVPIQPVDKPQVVIPRPEAKPIQPVSDPVYKPVTEPWIPAPRPPTGGVIDNRPIIPVVIPPTGGVIDNRPIIPVVIPPSREPLPNRRPNPITIPNPRVIPQGPTGGNEPFPASNPSRATSVEGEVLSGP